MKYKFLIITIVLGIFISLTSPLSAQISVNGRSGNLSITAPDGGLTTVASSDALPSLESGSVIEVLSGSADVALNGDEQLTIVAGESVINLNGGNAIKVDVKNNGADSLVSVLKGNVEMSVGEAILAIKAPAAIQTEIKEGKASVMVVEGEAAVVELDGKERPLEAGKFHNLGLITPSFGKGEE